MQSTIEEEPWMACVIGQPGMGNIKQLGRRVLLPSVIILAFVVVSSAVAAAWKGWAGLLSAVLGLAFGLAIWRRDYIALFREIRSDWHSWSRGARGEYDTARVLAELPDTFLVFHDYHPRSPDGQPAAWNIDHIVVGPTGIFLLDSKNYSQTRVEPAASNAHHARNVRQTQRNAKEFKKALSVWSAGDLDGQFVVPVVVYTQEKAYIVKTREEWVRVIPLRWLKSEITGRPASTLDAERAYRIARVLFAQMPLALREALQEDLDRFGAVSKHARELRMNRREPSTPELRARTVPAEEPASASTAASAGEPVPERCPQCGGALIRRTVRQGARAGCEILDHYLQDYILKKTAKAKYPALENKDNVARTLYALYNGGPGEFSKFLDRLAKKKFYASDDLFHEKYLWVKNGQWDKAGVCLVGE